MEAELRISFAIFSLTVIVDLISCFFLRPRPAAKGGIFRLLNWFPFYWLYFSAGGFALAALTLFWQAYDAPDRILPHFVDAFTSTVRMFSFEYGASDVQAMVFGEGMELSQAGGVYIAVLSFFVPLHTVGAVFSIFKDAVTELSFFCRFWKKPYIFSELNKESITLAEDIFENDKKALILFTGVSRIGSEEADEGMIGEAKRIGALMTAKSILDFNCRAKRSPYLYAIESKEENNLNNGILLFEKYKDFDVEIQVFSTLKSSDAFLDNVEKKDAKAKMNLINKAQIIAYSIFVEYPMYQAALGRRDKNISAMVIGVGTVGLECSKTAMWCSQMSQYHFNLRMIDCADRRHCLEDGDGSLRQTLKSLGLHIDYGFTQADVREPGFEKLLNEYDDANYIIVALGDDELTINTAIKIKRHYIRKAVEAGALAEYVEPMVIPIIHNPDYERLLHTNESGTGKTVFPYYSCYSSLFKKGTIDEWYIESFAAQIHSLYAPEVPYKTISQSERRSDRANAVHGFYKLKDVGVDIIDPEEGLVESFPGKREVTMEELEAYLDGPIDTGETGAACRSVADQYCGKGGICESRREHLAKLEHDRWSVFQLMDGWKPFSLNRIQSNLKGRQTKKLHKLEEGLLHGAIATMEDVKTLGDTLYQDENYLLGHDANITQFVGAMMIDTLNQQRQKKGLEPVRIFVDREAEKSLSENGRSDG